MTMNADRRNESVNTHSAVAAAAVAAHWSSVLVSTTVPSLALSVNLSICLSIHLSIYSSNQTSRLWDPSGSGVRSNSDDRSRQNEPGPHSTKSSQNGSRKHIFHYATVPLPLFSRYGTPRPVRQWAVVPCTAQDHTHLGQ